MLRFLLATFSGTNDKINTCRVYTFIVHLIVCCTVVQCRMRWYDECWFWLSSVYIGNTMRVTHAGFASV